MKEFSTALNFEEIKIDGDLYRINEMTEEGRRIYLKAVGSSMKVKMISTGKKDKKGADEMRKEIDVTDLAGAQLELLEATLVKAEDDEGKGTKMVPIKRDNMKGWGAKMIEDLAKIASELSGMDMPETKRVEDAEKN